MVMDLIIRQYTNQITNKFSDEIAMIIKSQSEMNISSWRFHVAFKNKLYTHEINYFYSSIILFNKLFDSKHL